ncbi:MAG: hypothetical protein DMG12_05385 [Acidobacteria bacterium]|nr:MAG: hypothetical protein DMG12_05385 [Acidobacteriota bacterium]
MFVRRTLFICAVMMAMASAFKLQASASAQAPAQTPAQAGAAGQTSSLSGSVADTQGGVIANAEVALSVWTPAMPGMKMTPAPSRTTRSTGNGTFALDQVPPGQYVLQVDAPGFAAPKRLRDRLVPREEVTRRRCWTV